jgi:hypothetical protein
MAQYPDKQGRIPATDCAPKMKRGAAPKNIKEAQPTAVPYRYAVATGQTAAMGLKSNRKVR